MSNDIKSQSLQSIYARQLFFFDGSPILNILLDINISLDDIQISSRLPHGLFYIRNIRLAPRTILGTKRYFDSLLIDTTKKLRFHITKGSHGQSKNKQQKSYSYSVLHKRHISNSKDYFQPKLIVAYSIVKIFLGKINIFIIHHIRLASMIIFIFNISSSNNFFDPQPEIGVWIQSSLDTIIQAD